LAETAICLRRGPTVAVHGEVTVGYEIRGGQRDGARQCRDRKCHKQESFHEGFSFGDPTDEAQSQNGKKPRRINKCILNASYDWGYKRFKVSGLGLVLEDSKGIMCNALQNPEKNTSLTSGRLKTAPKRGRT
jgi:hypothetical protein